LKFSPKREIILIGHISALKRALIAFLRREKTASTMIVYISSTRLARYFLSFDNIDSLERISPVTENLRTDILAYLSLFIAKK